LQVSEQIEVVDDARHLVLGAKAAAAAHPFGEGSMWDSLELRRTDPGLLRLVVEMAARQVAVESLGEGLLFRF
jgi:hypothetical protein